MYGVGLDSPVGRAPARQSGGRGFKSRSSKFVFVHSKFIWIISCNIFFPLNKTSIEMIFMLDLLSISLAQN